MLTTGRCDVAAPAKSILSSLAVLLTVLFLAPRLEATPNFMRKLRNPSDGCHACHTIMPRLNEFGYKFRAAGYRVPPQIGEEEERPFELGDYFSAGIISTYTNSRTTTGTVSSHTNQLGFSSIDMFPFTGSLGRNFASKVELDYAPNGSLSLNAAYVRYARGDQDKFFTARLGILPAEGYGAQDRSIGLSSPLFPATTANFNQNQFFTTGLKSAALEVGYDYKHTSVRASILEGAILINQNGAFSVYGAQGGSLSKPAGQVTSSTPDFSAQATQALTSNGGGVSVLYYHGHIGLPYLGSTTQFWKNEFDRVQLFGSYPVRKYLMLLAGYGWGRDHLQTGDAFASGGYFASAEVPFGESVSAGVRYDWADPARNKPSNQIAAVSSFVTMFLQNGLRVTAEFQHKDTLRGTSPDQFINSFQTRIAFYH